MTNENQFHNIFSISPKQLKSINLFWIGFILYITAYTISTTGHVNYIICQLIQIIGLILFVSTSIQLIQFKLENTFLQIVFLFYCIWSFATIARGFNFHYTYVKNMIFGAGYGVLLYFAPLILLFPRNFVFYKKMFEVIIILGIVSLLYDFLFIRDLLDRSPETQDVIEYFTKDLGITSGFILLTYKYHSHKKQLIALAVMLVSILFSIYKARRGLTFICASMLFFAFFIYFRKNKNKVLIIYLSVLFLILAVFYVNSAYRIKEKGLFSFILKREDEDTRTGVELYFYNDMKPVDWLVGRGINGKYFCPNIEENQETDYRVLIETGYLQIILKGGIIFLGLYLLLAIPAIILGIFFSKNLLSKAAGIWIFISLISLYPATVNTFNLNYLLVWICIGICYSGKIRKLPDYVIQEQLLSPLIKQ